MSRSGALAQSSVESLDRDTVRKMLAVLGAGGLRAFYCNKQSSLSYGSIV